jgi:hypothetical protein
MGSAWMIFVRDAVIPTSQMFEGSEIMKQEDKSMKKETNMANVISTSLPVNDIDQGFFSRISPDKISAYNKFTTAYNLDLESDQFDDADKRVKAMHLYLEAFDDGVSDAAVNMLRVLTKILFNIKAETLNANLPFQDRVEFFVEKVEEVENQEGQYYHAFLLIYGLMRTEDTEDVNLNNGLRKMYELANEGNEYAIHYVEYIEGGEEDNE